MNARAIDCDLETARIRGLQAIYAKSHAALSNWGRWSADRSDIYPKMNPPSIWDQFARSKVTEWGEEGEHAYAILQVVKSEPAEKRPYDERTACKLDERLHGAGGLPDYIRLCLRTAYVTKEIPEDQFPRLSGCTLDAFCERLEAALRFVSRFV